MQQGFMTTGMSEHDLHSSWAGELWWKPRRFCKSFSFPARGAVVRVRWRDWILQLVLLSGFLCGSTTGFNEVGVQRRWFCSNPSSGGSGGSGVALDPGRYRTYFVMYVWSPARLHLQKVTHTCHVIGCGASFPFPANRVLGCPPGEKRKKQP